MASVVLLLLSIISLPTWAQFTCSSNSSVDLTRGSGSLAQVSPMDQSSTGLCYAFTVSQLADARRYAAGATRGRVSPLALGLMTSRSTNVLTASRTEGGSIVATTAQMNAQGAYICDERKLQSIIGDIDDQFTYFGTIEEMFRNLRAAHFCNERLEVKRQRQADAIASLRIWLTDPRQLRAHPTGGISDFVNDMGAIVANLARLPASAFGDYNRQLSSGLLGPVFQRMCEGAPVRVPRVNLVGMSREGFPERNSGFPTIPSSQWPSRSTAQAWDLLASSGAQPVGINFCSKILTGTNTWMSPTIGGGRCGNHAAVLAGFRCVRGRKQFLLRNSWGNNCGDDLASRLRGNCDGRGNLWIDAEHLMKSSYSIYKFR